VAIAPRAPLSQVVFVHDYFQLVFQGETLSVYNQASVHRGSAVFAHGEPGFFDALLQLIGQQATATPAQPGIMLALRFTSGTELRVQDGGASPAQLEGFSFSGHAGAFVVGHNQ